MVVLARVVLLLSSSSNRPMSDASSESSSRTGAGSPSMSGAAHDEESGIVHGDIVKALSGAHLREVGISLKAARPGWQEAHVQVRGRGFTLYLTGVFQCLRIGEGGGGVGGDDFVCHVPV